MVMLYASTTCRCAPVPFTDERPKGELPIRRSGADSRWRPVAVVVLLLGVVAVHPARAEGGDDTSGVKCPAKQGDRGFDDLVKLGKVLQQKGDINAAFACFGDAVSASPQEPDGYLHYGVAATALGRYSAAQGALRRAYEMTSDLRALIALTNALDKGDGKGESLALWERVFPENKDSSEVNFYYGMSLLTNGRVQDGFKRLEQAVRLNPKRQEYTTHLAGLYKKSNMIPQAINIYQSYLKRNPKDPQVLSDFGLLLQQDKQHAEAVRVFRELDATGRTPAHQLPQLKLLIGTNLLMDNRVEEAITELEFGSRSPHSPADVFNNLGQAYERVERYDDSHAMYRTAVEKRPTDHTLQRNLGMAAYRAGRWDEARKSFEKVLELGVRTADVYNDLACALEKLGSHSAAVENYRVATRLNPKEPSYHKNLGTVLYEVGMAREAIESLTAALRLETSADTWSMLARAHVLAGDFGAAVDAATSAIKVVGEGDALRYRMQRAEALYRADRFDEAIREYQGVIEARPSELTARVGLMHCKFRVCDWSGRDEELSLITNHVKGLLQDGSPGSAIPLRPFHALIYPVDPGILRDISAAHARALVPENGFRVLSHPRLKVKKRLAVGYLSGDFRAHAVGYLVMDMFCHHDSALMKVYGFSSGPNDRSAARKGVSRCLGTRLRDVSALSYEGTAEEINRAKIHLLVDLGGWTNGHRMPVLARRPAPVQIHFLGYEATTGARGIVDAMVTDPVVSPPEFSQDHTERMVYLPPSKRISSHRSSWRRGLIEDSGNYDRSRYGLPEDGLVFANFNTLYKIDPAVFTSWMRILARVPGSVLWLLKWNDASQANLLATARDHGIDAGRVRFTPRISEVEHIYAFRNADLVLDTTLYHAHTTGGDALWAGVPVISMAAAKMAARVSPSMALAQGTPYLVAASLEEYEHLAVSLAKDPVALSKVTARVRAARIEGRLFDTAGVVRGLERLYEMHWDAASFGGDGTASSGKKGSSVRSGAASGFHLSFF